jgi:hypothetical protein
MQAFNILLFLAVILDVTYHIVVEMCHQFCPELEAAAVSELLVGLPIYHTFTFQ